MNGRSQKRDRDKSPAGKGLSLGKAGSRIIFYKGGWMYVFSKV